MEKRTVDIVVANIKQIRKSKGIPQKEMAQRMDVPQSRYSVIENGKNELNLATVDKVAKALEVSALDLFINSEEKGRALLDKLEMLQRLPKEEREMIEGMIDIALEKYRMEQEKIATDRMAELKKIRSKKTPNRERGR